MTMVVAGGLDVVAGEEDGVGARDLEKDALPLSNGDVDGLLVVLENCMLVSYSC